MAEVAVSETLAGAPHNGVGNQAIIAALPAGVQLGKRIDCLTEGGRRKDRPAALWDDPPLIRCI